MVRADGASLGRKNGVDVMDPREERALQEQRQALKDKRWRPNPPALMPFSVLGALTLLIVGLGWIVFYGLFIEPYRRTKP
jgi:hypothetical protein